MSMRIAARAPRDQRASSPRRSPRPGSAVPAHAARHRAGERRRRRDRRQRRHRRGARRAPQGRQRRRRGRRRGRRARRRPSRSRPASAAAASWSSARPDGKVTTIDWREKAPAAMRPDSFIENGTPLPFNDARYSGLSAGVPGTPAGWDQGAAQVRHAGRSSRSLAPGIDVAARGLRDRPDLLRPDRRRTSPWFDDITGDRGALPRPGRHAARPRHGPAQPGHGAHLRAIAQLGAKRGFYRGPVAEAMVRAARQPPHRADRRPRPGGPA